jgi:hypothetical protein
MFEVKWENGLICKKSKVMHLDSSTSGGTAKTMLRLLVQRTAENLSTFLMTKLSPDSDQHAIVASDRLIMWYVSENNKRTVGIG